MSQSLYWRIDYAIHLKSDFHIGAGITLLGGNLHGLRLDENGMPYLPHTQVRGLMRLGGHQLQNWQPGLKDSFRRNFEDEKHKSGVFWSYSRAAVINNPLLENGFQHWGLLKEQTHVHINADGVTENMFRYEKGGPLPETWDGILRGCIYSVEPAIEQDAAFLIAAMRAEDRIGHRRSRAYGKADWRVERVWKYPAGGALKEETQSPERWIDVLFNAAAAAKNEEA
jgi:hypothetical protein